MGRQEGTVGFLECRVTNCSAPATLGLTTGSWLTLDKCLVQQAMPVDSGISKSSQWAFINRDYLRLTEKDGIDIKLKIAVDRLGAHKC